MTTTTEHLFQGNKNWSSLPKSLYVDVHDIIICNSPKLEIVWYRSMTEQLKNKQTKNPGTTYCGLQQNIKKENYRYTRQPEWTLRKLAWVNKVSFKRLHTMWLFHLRTILKMRKL